MKLHEIGPAAGARRSKRRVGRGPGSGLGKTAGRGHKGQKSRSGYSRKRGFEGGRLPKRGFTNLFRTEYRIVNISRLNDFEAGSVVSPETLQQAGLLKKGTAGVKILGDGELKVALTVQAHRFTRQAAEKIKAAGGTVEQLTR